METIKILLQQHKEICQKQAVAEDEDRVDLQMEIDQIENEILEFTKNLQQYSFQKYVGSME